MSTRTRSLLCTGLAGVLALALCLPAGAEQAADATYTLEAGDSATHAGEFPPGGVNPLFFEQAPGVGGHETCSKSPDTYCETILLELVNPVADTNPDALETATRTVSVALSTEGLADYDLFLFRSDAEGTKGAELSRSTAFPTGGTGEFVSGSVRTTEEDDTAWALVQVVYFAPTSPMSLAIGF